MALDGAFLYLTAAEIRDALIGSRIEKIMQPSREEIMLAMRTMQGGKKLLLSANANSPRAHLTELTLENPKQPPMFCMLLRKHLGSGRLLAVRQNGLDRVLTLDFETVNELGDKTVTSLIVEIMGRHSNIILVNEQGKILDAIKRVGEDVSSVRLVLPGMAYQPPPPQEKLNLLETDEKEWMARFIGQKTTDTAKALMGTFEGISPLLARELAYRALKGQEIPKDLLSDFYRRRLVTELQEPKQKLCCRQAVYTVAVNEEKKIRDFTWIDICQYGSGVDKQVYAAASALLDRFYAERDQIGRMKQRSHDLLKLLVNATDRISRKLSLQAEERRECANREQWKQYGDLIHANLYAIHKGDRVVKAQNFYEEGCPEVEIPLDARLTPVQNAQKYYAEYRKAATADQKLNVLMQEGEAELAYLDSVFDAVTRTQGESELLEIRQELAEQGYIRASRQKGKPPKSQPPLRYCSSDGFTILCGRNNKQNDQLTLKTAKKSDIWFHTQGIPGSHVIVLTEGKEVPDRTLTEAAVIAAYHSKGRLSAKVAVDYTCVKNVKKPNGAKPGMVIFTDNRTAYVAPDREWVERLADTAQPG